MDKLSKKSHIKRLNYEIINEILPLGYDVKLHLTNKTDINVIIIIKKHKITFHIKEKFPFQPPFIYINNYTYLDMLRTSFSNILKKINGMECLCCYTSLCNWEPTIKLIDLINEIEYVINIKERIMKRYYAKKIQDKYINDELFNCIESFL